MKHRKLLFTLIGAALAATMLFGLAACSYKGADYDTVGSGSNGSADEVGTGDNVVFDVNNRKVYYTVDLTYTADNPAAVGAKIKEQTKAFGGYVEGSSESSGDDYSYNYYELRIPTEKLEAFLTAIEGAGDLGHKSVSTVDITGSYVSAQAYVEALENERTKLNELLSAADKVSDVLAITTRISEINARLGALERELNSYDSLMDYSQVTVRISQPIKPSVASIVVPIVVTLIIVGGIVAIVIICLKRRDKKKARNKKDEQITENKEDTQGTI